MLIEQRLAAIEELLRQQIMNQKEILSLNEVSKYLNVSSSYLYKLTCTKQIPHYIPTGKKIFFKRSEIDGWLLQNRQSTRAEIENQALDYINTKGGKR